MLTLKADNRLLTANSQTAYLVNNQSSGSSTLTLTNVTALTVDKFLLVGEWGDESTEYFRIGAIDTSTGIVSLKDPHTGAGATTEFAHAESTAVHQMDFNQINFYWTAATGTITDETPTFATSTPLTTGQHLDPSSFYTVYADSAHSTGFGWFFFYNSVDTTTSSTSNPMPYAGFAANTVEQVFADFDSLLNVRELKLVSLSERFAWLNEALALLKNKLNLSNVEYTVSTPQTLSIVSGTAEYQLPADFADVVSITDGQNTSTSSGYDIPYMSIANVQSYRGDVTHYYLRGRYLGIVPTPGASATYYYRYRAKSTRVTSLSDYIDLPDHAFYSLKDFMMYRASLKFQSGQAAVFYQSFTNSVNLFMQSAVKRDSDLDTWGSEPSSMV